MSDFNLSKLSSLLVIGLWLFLLTSVKATQKKETI